jgi:3-hydroxyacyl-CoA dehydrogenase
MKVESAAVVGSGTMGSGIAMNFANVGIDVRMIDASWEALTRGLATIDRTYAAAVEKGRLTAEQRDMRLGRIGTSTELAGLGSVDVVVEAVFEEMALDLPCGCDPRDQHVDARRR